MGVRYGASAGYGIVLDDREALAVAKLIDPDFNEDEGRWEAAEFVARHCNLDYDWAGNAMCDDNVQYLFGLIWRGNQFDDSSFGYTAIDTGTDKGNNGLLRLIELTKKLPRFYVGMSVS